MIVVKNFEELREAVRTCSNFKMYTRTVINSEYLYRLDSLEYTYRKGLPWIGGSIWTYISNYEGIILTEFHDLYPTDEMLLNEYRKPYCEILDAIKYYNILMETPYAIG